VRQEELDILSIPEPEWLSFEESNGAAYRVTLPLRPAVELGAYRDYPFGITLNEVTDQRVEQVVDELRDQQATLVPVEGRGAQKGDYAVIRFEGRREGQPIEGARTDRMPLVVGDERLLPGFEDQLLGMNEGDESTFEHRFPDDYPEQALAGQTAEFTVGLLELREKRLPAADDDFARSIGTYDDLPALREEVRGRLERRELDRARHAFADRIIEFAVANASVELPDLLIERELEVMFDELRIRLAEQGIGWEDYLRVTERDEAKLREEFRPDAERRVKTLLVLSEIAEKEQVEVDDATLAAELERSRQRYAGNQRLLEYLESARGQAYTRSLLRRSQTIEKLIDEWIEQHPEFANVQHLHEDSPETDTEAQKGNA
jgi:trigger factor